MSLVPRPNRMSHAASAALAAGLFLAGAACAPPAAPPPPPPPPLIESDLAPRADPRIEVVELQELPTRDPLVVSVVGVVSNRGDEPTAQLLIRVRALDAADRTVEEVVATPETERVPPRGATRFQALMRVTPEVVGYHAEALARWPARASDPAGE